MPQKDLVLPRKRTNPQQSLHQPQDTFSDVSQVSHQNFRSTLIDSEPIFTIDRSGDIQNLRYGEPDRYKTSRYHSFGRGSLIGLDRRYKLVNTEDRKRELLDTSLDSVRRRQDLSFSTIDTSEASAVETTSDIEADQDEVVLQLDYVNLGSKRRRTSNCSKTSGSDAENDVQSGKRKHQPDGMLPNLPSNECHRRNMMLREQTKNHPQDLQAWLDLVALQDEIVVPEGSGEGYQLSAREKRIASQMKISILETAASQVTDLGSKNRLLLALMKEGSQNWDVTQQKSKWQKLMQNHPSFELEIEHLNWLQSTSTEFSIEACLRLFQKLFQERRVLSSADPRRDSESCYLLLRVTRFLAEAGFTERAIGIWQAALEINLFKPAGLVEPAIGDPIQAFWDSEAPRIGEERSGGWNASSQQGNPTREDPLIPFLQKDSQLHRWAEAEEKAAECMSLPARTLDLVAEADPYRIVLFDDIKDYLFECSIDFRGFLIQAFLQFVGLPSMSGSYSPILRMWECDPYLAGFSLLPVDAGSALSGQTHTSTISHAVPDTATLFFNVSSDGPLVTNPLETWSMTAINQIASEHILTEYGEHLAELVVALYQCNRSVKARKAAKSFLKKFPESLLLYNAYAIQECRNNSFEAAERVWKAALSLPQGGSGEEVKQLLWQSWTSECLKRSLWSHALGLFHKMSGIGLNIGDADLSTAENTTPVSQLRIKQYLYSALAKAINTAQIQLVAASAELLAVFLYISSERDVHQIHQAYSSVFLTLETTASQLMGNSMLDELLHQDFTRLIDLHARLSPPGSTRPKELVSMLRPSYTAYPENTIIWSIYHQHLRRAGIIEHLREVEAISTYPAAQKGISQPLKRVRPPTIVTPLLSIATELNRPSYAGSTQHNIRAAFKRAAENSLSDSQVTLHRSPAFWVNYLSWEISQIPNNHSTSQNLLESDAVPNSHTSSKEKKASKKHNPAREALNVFHASLRSCPGVKKLYLLALSSHSLIDLMGPEAAKAVYDLMIDRGLRVRVELHD